ncbi:hypothetical protein [Bacillus sp. 3a]|uniref:hypothetical protein n=1 Tax=Bacillus sp. 3a TaxID=580459 RepID=UPI001F499BEE|nr:hypothetical protein [Bacillus sp. 3a]
MKFLNLQKKKSLESNNEGKQNNSVVVAGAGLKSFKKNLEGNLFYKKLKLEKINPALIELSSVFMLRQMNILEL